MKTGPILLAEDDEDDLFLVQRACERAGLANPLHVVRDGEQLLDYLQGRGPYADRDRYPFPELCLLDIKMPGMDGLEALSVLRSDPCLQRLVVIVLTSSDQERDINAALDLRANSYLVKPAQLDDLTSLLATLKKYWVEMNHFPLCPAA